MVKANAMWVACGQGHTFGLGQLTLEKCSFNENVLLIPLTQVGK